MADKTKLTILLDGDVRRAFKSWCALHDTSMAAVLTRLAADLSGSGGGDGERLARAWYDHGR